MLIYVYFYTIHNNFILYEMITTIPNDRCSATIKLYK